MIRDKSLLEKKQSKENTVKNDENRYVWFLIEISNSSGQFKLKLVVNMIIWMYEVRILIKTVCSLFLLGLLSKNLTC
jgi:hypothetical protein